MGGVFSDAGVEPTSAAIREALGSRSQAWEQTLAMFAEAGVLVSWRYYHDGGWVAKATRGKKTVAWVTVEDGFVRVSFYFAERHRAALAEADGLARQVRDRISATPVSGRLLPVTFEVRERADLDPVRAVLAVKLTAK
jgi:hypothetical protein